MILKSNNNKNKNQFYEMLIFNIGLSFSIIILICSNFYKLAFVAFVSLIINNNILLKGKFEDYTSEQKKFNNFYKKKFPVLFYVLPAIGFISLGGLFYTGYVLNEMHSDILSQRVHISLYKERLNNFEILFTGFCITFFSYLIIDWLIAMYVIQKANSPIQQGWKVAMAITKTGRNIAMGGSAVIAAGTIVSTAPEATPASNFINTKTPFGRGWDVEPGEGKEKLHASNLQSYLGHKQFIKLIQEENQKEENTRIVTRNTITKILAREDVKKQIMEANLSPEELYALGYTTLGSVAGSAATDAISSGAKESVQGLLSSIYGWFFSEEAAPTSDSNKETPTVTFAEEPVIIPDNPSKNFVDDSSDVDSTMDTPDEDFKEKQKDVPKGNPAQKAVKDQDLVEARNRLKKK